MIQAGIRTLDEEGKKGDKSSVRNAQNLSKKFKLLMHSQGIEIGRSLNWRNNRISLCPVIVGSTARLCYLLRKIVHEEKILLFGSAYPACAMNRSLFRVVIRGDMTEEIVTNLAKIIGGHIRNTPNDITLGGDIGIVTAKDKKNE